MTHLGQQARSTRSARAFTLVEMVLAATIMSIILLGMQSAILLASRATPDRNSGNSAALRSGRAVDQLSSDLTYATSITTATANTIVFTVPDRNSDGSPETIRYSWSGVTGDSLLRTLNGGSPAAIAPGVTEFQLIYDKRSQQRSTSYTESGEVLLTSYDQAGTLYLGHLTIDEDNFAGEYFKPSLPSDASQWRVTRVKFKARSNSGSTGQARVQIRTASGTTPKVVLEETMMYESNLSSSYAWQEFAFSNVSGRIPNTALCLVLQWNADSQACDVQYRYFGAYVPSTNVLKSDTAGATWTAPGGQELLFYVYGTYSTANPVAYDYWLTGVRCTLRSGSDPLGRVRTTIRVLNEPQVSGP